MGVRGPKPGTGKKRGGRKPGQRNLATRDIKAMTEPYGPEAVETLLRIMRRDKSSMARIAAAKEILDRGFGKASQPLTANGSGNIVIEIIRFGPTLDISPAQEALPSPGDDP